MSVSPRGRTRKNWGDDDSGTPILHVDMDSFFASVELIRNPELVGRPVVVGGTSNRGVVTSATYEARAFGVSAGMPIGQARSRCPQAVFLAGEHSLYKEYSQRVMSALSQFTPRLEQLSIDEAFLDVSGARRQLGSPTEVAQKIRWQVKQETGLPASVGVAAVKSVAKIASAHAKPDGLLLIPKDQTTAFLHPLPIGALWGVGGKTGEVLKARGIDTIGDLANTPLKDLIRWLGDVHARGLRDLAWGIDKRTVSEGAREKSISTERTFETDVKDPARIQVFLLEAAHECAARLRVGSLVAWTVVIKVRNADFQTLTRSRTLHVPTDVGREIAESASALFSSLPFPQGGVRLAGVGVSNLVDIGSGVPMPLDDDPRARATEVVMDAARDRFGFGALAPASLLGNRDET